MTEEYPVPNLGKELPCLVCATVRPWGVFDPKSGVAVCKDCRDGARELDSLRHFFVQTEGVAPAHVAGHAIRLLEGRKSEQS